jgi:hypothetical protein
LNDARVLLVAMMRPKSPALIIRPVFASMLPPDETVYYRVFFS